LKDRIGRAVVVENKTGAAGRLAVEAVKTSPPDGTVLVLANIAQMSVAPSIYKDLPYDPLKDFTAIGKVTDFQIALVTGKQTGARTYAETLTWLRANPDKANSGNPGNGSLPHLYGFELGNATGIKLQAVPYRGGAPIVAALTQGELAIGWASITDFIEQHRAGQVQIIAVTGSVRSPQLANVPTFRELSVPTLSGNGWIGLFGPAKMPTEIVSLYEREMGAVMADAGVQEKLVSLGLIVAPTNSAALAAQVEADLLKWKPIIQKAGIAP
jgi:tripartite-type tricarboxylate transporter receptor subunit TctC